MSPLPPLPAAPTVTAIPAQPNSLLRVVGNDQLQAQDAAQVAAQQAAAQSGDIFESQLISHMHKRMQEMRNFRNAEGVAERLIGALRAYKGKYDAARLTEIRKFGGSEVYARLTTTKCRASTALLRDIYLSAERPWDIEPTPVPETPTNIEQSIQQLVAVEAATLQQSGQQIDPQVLQDRVSMLRAAAEQAAKHQARKEAARSADKLDDILIEGNFYQALAEFLIDLPIFPFAIIKGPTVRRQSQLKWTEGKATLEQIPKMFWNRVSPFDLYWSPGAACVEEAEFIERIRLSRADLLSLKGLPGYDDEAISAVLDHFSDTGFHDWWDVTDSERARLENREQWPRHTTNSLLDTAEYHGSVSGKTLIDWGKTSDEITDPEQEYRVQVWMIDRYVIKVQLNPSPSQRSPYYISNFEKVPGTLIGYSLHDLLEDIQGVANAAVRALVNNMGICSGPQVIINDAVVPPGENDDLYPWKRWHVRFDPMVTGTSKPVDFFQPGSNSNELLGVYQQFSVMADEVSAIPRYMTGNEKLGGAGRTASGLAMLMGNAAKTLQNVAASIDRDVIAPLLDELYNMVMLTMPGLFRGDEQVVVKGVNYAVKREQDRMRQLEFLQITGNPIDLPIIGMEGRANVLRSVASNLGLDSDRVVPDDEQIRAQQQAQQQMAAQQQGAPGAPQANQIPRPEDQRAPAEEARRPIEGQMSSGVTGRPGMRAGG